MSLFKSFFTVSFYTMMSRVLGFVRDIIMASILGVSGLAEVFLVAFKLPNLFRRVFAEGAFSNVFVPLYAHKKEDEGREKALEFSARVFTILTFALVLLTLAFELAMPWVMQVLAPGFARDAEKMQLAVELSRVTFPYLLFLSLVAFYGGMLNSEGKFGAMASAPVLLNICLILTLLNWEVFSDNPARALAYAVLVAGVVQFIWLLFFAARAKLLVFFVKPKMDGDIRLLLKRMVPGVIGAGVMQINVWLDVVIATFVPGAIAFLYYADRINQLPLSVVGTAMGTALLPMLSRSLKRGDIEAAVHTRNRAMECVIFFVLPATTALLIIAHPIISILFERGEFSAQSSVATAYALMGYAIGLPAIVMAKVNSSAFFALGDTTTPVKVGIVTLVINLVLNISFVMTFPMMGWMPHVGLAIATSIAAWCNVLLLSKKLRVAKDFSTDEKFWVTFKKVTLMTFVMGVFLVVAQWLLGEFLTKDSAVRYVAFIALVGGGIGVYFLMAYFVGMLNLRKIVGKRS